MNPVQFTAEAVVAHEAGPGSGAPLPTPLDFLIWLPMAATGLSLVIAGVVSLAIWGFMS